MGYDDDECLLCYLIHSENNNDDENDEDFVCCECIEHFASKSHFPERVTTVLRDTFTIDFDLFCYCKNTRKLGFLVMICEDGHDK
jgi:hypothetical protein